MSTDDQLIKIMEVLGKQEDDSLNFVDDKNVLKYIKMIHKTIDKPKFESKFSNLSRSIIELL